MALDTYRVGKTIPSRPTKLTLVLIVAGFIGFIAIAMTQGEAFLKAEQQSGAPSTAATQPVQPAQPAE